MNNLKEDNESHVAKVLLLGHHSIAHLTWFLIKLAKELEILEEDESSLHDDFY